MSPHCPTSTAVTDILGIGVFKKTNRNDYNCFSLQPYLQWMFPALLPQGTVMIPLQLSGQDKVKRMPH